MTETARKSTPMAHYPEVQPNPDFPKIEEQVLARWAKDETFKKSIEQRPALLDAQQEAWSADRVSHEPAKRRSIGSAGARAGNIKRLSRSDSRRIEYCRQTDGEPSAE